MIENAVFEQIGQQIVKAERVLIIAHRAPDADTLGAAVAVKTWLSRKEKFVVMACIDKPAKVFSFLPYVGEFIDNFALDAFDLVIVVDSGASHMTNFHLKYPNLFTSGIPVINIDHHASNERYGTINLVDPSAASTTVILCRLFKYLDVRVNPQMATCLLAGIYSDTGSFMHSNTNKEAFELAASLIACGAEISSMSKKLFNTKDLSTLKLWGRTFENAKMTEKGVVVSIVGDDDYNFADAGPSQLSGVVDYLNMVPNSKYAVLLNEDRKGNVKASFRTRLKDLDLSKIAANFGGGGHPKASGFSIPGKLKSDLRLTIVPEDGSEKKTLDF